MEICPPWLGSVGCSRPGRKEPGWLRATATMAASAPAAPPEPAAAQRLGLPLYLAPPATGMLRPTEVAELGGARLQLLANLAPEPALSRMLAAGEAEPGATAAGTEAEPAGPAGEGDDGEGDAVSHFLVRIALCGEPRLRRWLVAKEMALLAVRWGAADEAERRRSAVHK